MKKSHIFLWLYAFCLMAQAHAAYYSTLPKGTRLLALRKITTSSIDSSYNPYSENEKMDLKINLDSNTLSSIPELAGIMEEIKNASAQAYNTFTLGSYDTGARAEVDVNAIGAAYGISNRLTVYASVPYYKAQTKVYAQRTAGHNYADAARIIELNGINEIHQILADVLREEPVDPNLSTLQALVVANGYEPLGTWSGEGFGDVEVAMIYRLTDQPNWGLAFTGGVALPTGRGDNPNNLQDFNFGDQQYDLFTEFGGGFSLNQKWEFDSYMRYTYQASSTKRLRVIESADFPLSNEVGSFKEKLGDKFLYSVSSTFFATDWFSIKPQLIYNYKFQNTYNSQYALANEALAQDTEEISTELKLTLNFSSVKMYNNTKSVLPADIYLSGQKIIFGKNTPEYTRYDFEVRFYF